MVKLFQISNRLVSKRSGLGFECLFRKFTKMVSKNALCCAMLAVLGIAFTGCGGTAGFDVSGKVTFGGKPIPKGKIYFFPDGSKKNTGASGFADIKDGTYNTASPGGQKIIGGPMIVKIEGFDPSAKGPETPGDTSGEVTIKSLFPAYETTADFPKGTNT